MVTESIAGNDYATYKSTKNAVFQQSVIPDTIDNENISDTVVQEIDSINSNIVQPDTIINIPPKKNDIDNPVFYNALDSSFFDLVEQKAYLYGEAKVVYGDITLTAEYIMMDFGQNEVYAHGVTDTAGVVQGKPIFTQGEETFDADTIRYNFRSKKGLIKEVTTDMDGSYLHGGKTKKHPNDQVHLTD
ncbi:MAG: hypothetical protein PHE08_09015, partial [Bacteroidales bacterium]|nr:hypothetical protein [Bacteroidales bacterium]